MTKNRCNGCHNNVYNNGLNGVTECWLFKEAKLIRRVMVSINQMPPYPRKSSFYPSCYQVPRFAFLSLDNPSVRKAKK